MVDTVRGVLRIRKWPKKRGPPKSEAQKYWVDWFRQANYLAKYVDAATMRRAITITKGSGMYPRDVILKAMRGRLYSWVDQTGNRWHSMAAIQDISESLDVLAQQVGSVLVRAADRWRAATGGVVGHVLTYQGLSAAPAWQAVTAPAVFSLACLLNRSSSWSLPNGSTTPIPFNNELHDPLNMHDNSSNPEDVVIPSGYSWARCTTFVHVNSNTTGQRVVGIRKNAATFPGYSDLSMSSKDTNLQRLSQITPWFPVTAGDILTMVAFQNSGSAQSIGTTVDNLSFAVELA